MEDLTTLFCSVYDFWTSFESEWNNHLIGSERRQTGPEPELSVPEMMTIVILFHQFNFRTFKHFFSLVCQQLRKEFPKLISYSRFVYLTKTLCIPLFAYLLHRK